MGEIPEGAAVKVSQIYFQKISSWSVDVPITSQCPREKKLIRSQAEMYLHQSS